MEDNRQMPEEFQARQEATEEQLETALIPLMAEVFHNEILSVNKAIKEE